MASVAYPLAHTVGRKEYASSTTKVVFSSSLGITRWAGRRRWEAGRLARLTRPMKRGAPSWGTWCTAYASLYALFLLSCALACSAEGGGGTAFDGGEADGMEGRYAPRIFSVSSMVVLGGWMLDCIST